MLFSIIESTQIIFLFKKSKNEFYNLSELWKSWNYLSFMLSINLNFDGYNENMTDRNFSLIYIIHLILCKRCFTKNIFIKITYVIIVSRVIPITSLQL